MRRRSFPGDPPQPPQSHGHFEAGDFLSAQEAARYLGTTATTLYDWLGQSDRGLLVIRGQPFTFNYFQGGARGQGRIRIEIAEVERLLEQMRVQPSCRPPRRTPTRQQVFPGITVKLGRPDGLI